MIKSASSIRSAARVALKGHWAEAAMFTFVCMLISQVFSVTASVVLDYIQTGIGSLVSLLLLPLSWGFAVAFLSNARGVEDPFSISRMFDGYRDFGRIFTTMLLQMFYLIMWTLLLIIPGIIKSFSYSMTSFILRDNPEMKNNEAIELSMKMMDGHKADYFWLQLTFVGWAILCFFTFGIGYFWLIPYMQASVAQFYEEVKADYEQKRER